MGLLLPIADTPQIRRCSQSTGDSPMIIDDPDLPVISDSDDAEPCGAGARGAAPAAGVAAAEAGGAAVVIVCSKLNLLINVDFCSSSVIYCIGSVA